MSYTEANIPVVEPHDAKPKASIKQQAKSDAIEFAKILYDIYTKERDNAKVVSGQNNDIMS